MKKYPIGTTIKSRSQRSLTGRIIGYTRDSNFANIVEWHDGHRPNWQNHWYDENFDQDPDKELTPPIIFPEDLFTL